MNDFRLRTGQLDREVGVWNRTGVGPRRLWSERSCRSCPTLMIRLAVDGVLLGSSCLETLGP